MACIITHNNKKYTQPEFNEYFKSHFFEFVGDFLGSKQNIEGFKEFVGSNRAAKNPNTSQTQYQVFQDREVEEFVASEKTVRDLAARMSDRIGISVRFESDRTKEYKGKIENNTAVINLAYATLDTPIHEILGHPIIRAIKQGSTFKIEETLTEKDADKIIEKNQIIEKNGIRYEAAYDAPDGTIVYRYDKRIQTKPNIQLYQNLLKELEYGKGKEVLDRIKRDYSIKGYEYISEEEAYNRFSSQKDMLNFGWKLGDIDYRNGSIYYKIPIKYTLEEQQEEAIVELLGLYAAGKLDNIKDGKLISLLKSLLKEMKVFMKQLLRQKEVEIDKLPDNMTLGDIADLLAYSNSKLILPGNEVIYTTPDNQTFKTYAEASKHISDLAKIAEDVDLNNIKIENELPDRFVLNEFDEHNSTEIYFKENGQWYLETQGGTFFNKEKITEEKAKKDYTKYAKYQVNLNSFIERNKEYEQSKEIIEEWKKVNNIQYNPEEVYSRGQEFVSVVGAYSNFDVNLMMQNLLQHIEDNKKAGGEFVISAFTKPIDRQIGHLEGGGGKIKFKIYPQSQDIKWAANTDVFSGSVWDASEKVSKDKKSELLGVSYTKYPSLSNVDKVQPNLANIIDNLSYHHNELGISLTGSNFRLEYDENIPYSTKKLINSINSILDQKYEKLIKPEIKKAEKKQVGYSLILDFNDGEISVIKEFKTEKEANDALIEERKKQTREDLQSGFELKVLPKIEQGKQPTQTNETLKESIEDVKNRLQIVETGSTRSLEAQIKYKKQEIAILDGILNTSKDSTRLKKSQQKKEQLLKDIEILQNKIDNPSLQKEYTEQALINAKIAKLKEVAKIYPRSLIISEVRPISSNSNLGFVGDELPFQKAFAEGNKTKKGVQELFESNPELANAVYEAAGFKTQQSNVNSETIEIVKDKIKSLRDEDGSVPDNKINEFKSLRNKIKFLENSTLSNINRALLEFIDKNKLSESDARYLKKLATIRDTFQELVEDFNAAKKTNYTTTEIMSFFNKEFNLQESIKNESEINKEKNQQYEKNLLANNGFEANKDYTADELDEYVQKHGSKQVKFIWNLIKVVAQRLGVTTRFMIDGTHKIPENAAGHYFGSKIENRASLFSHPQSAARIIVHELVHGVTTYILKAAEQNNTKVLSKLTSRQLKAVEKLNKLFEELKRDKEFDDTYGTKNTHELLAELTNESFTDKLKAKNIFEKVLEAIFEIFNVSFNAYNESIKILEDLISNPIKENRYEGSEEENFSLYAEDIPQPTPQQKQQAQQLYSQYLEQNSNGSVEGFKSWVNGGNKFLQESGSLATISQSKIDNLQSTIEYQLLNEKDEDLDKKVGQSYMFLSEKNAERFTYLVEKHKKFPEEFKVTKKITKYERDYKNPLKFNGYNKYVDFYYIKSNKNKKSNLYDIVNKETGEVIASKVRILSVSKDVKSEIANKYGLEHTPTKIFSANRSIAFALYRQKPSKAKYIAQAKKYLYDAIKFLNPEETNLKINLDKIEELLSSFPEEMWDYINTTYSPEDSTNINASISLQNEIKFNLPKLGFLQEIEKITGIPLKGVSFKNYDRSGSLAKVFKYSKLDGEWGDTITIDNSMTTKELKASIRYYLSTKKIFKPTSEEENVRKYAEHRGIDYNKLRELVFGDIDKALDDIAYNQTGNSDTIELSKWRESIRNYDWQSVELFSKPYENFQNTVKERIIAKFKDKNLSNGVSHLEYFFNANAFNWLNINFNNISGQYYMTDMETEANVGVETKMGGIINPFEMKVYQKPKAGKNFLQEKEVFNRLAAILHEPFHALHALSYGTKEELELRKAFDNLYRTDFGKEMMNQVFGSGYNQGKQVSYDTLYKEFTAFTTQLMLYPKQWIKNTDLRSNDIYDFIEKIQTLQDKTYEEIVKTQQKIGTTETTITEEEKIKLTFLEKLYNYLVKALNKIIPLSKKFTNLIADSKLVEKKVIEDVFGEVEEIVTKKLKLPENVKKSKQEFLQAMDELQSSINTLMQIDAKLFSSENITNFFTSNKFNQEEGSKRDIEEFKKFVNNINKTTIEEKEILSSFNQDIVKHAFKNNMEISSPIFVSLIKEENPFKDFLKNKDIKIRCEDTEKIIYEGNESNSFFDIDERKIVISNQANIEDFYSSVLNYYLINSQTDDSYSKIDDYIEDLSDSMKELLEEYNINDRTSFIMNMFNNKKFKNDIIDYYQEDFNNFLQNISKELNYKIDSLLEIEKNYIPQENTKREEKNLMAYHLIDNISPC